MKNTPLTAKHIELGAKMTDFAGYNMPVSYTTLKEEHLAVRQKAGIFDVSHMGEFIIRGREALDLIQYVTSNNAANLQIGQVQYSCLPNEQGGIVDDLLVYRLPEDMAGPEEKSFMLVVNASNIDKDWNWINKHNRFDTQVINISDQTGLLAIQGPDAARILQPLTEVDLSSIKYYTFVKDIFAGLDNVLISATGYTGAGGFELYVAAEKLSALWDAILEAGKPEGLLPVGLGARDTLRLEMGYCLYGNDITDTTSPLEAGLGWITKLKKGPFVNREFLSKQKEAGLSRKLVGFRIEDRRVPRQGYTIEDENGSPIGEVTSGTLSPSLEIPIGMGYVKEKWAAVDTPIVIDTGRKKLKGKVVKPPFLKS